MSRDKELNEWAGRLEAGERGQPELALAARLQESRPAAPPLPPAFKSQLRGRLLDRYDRPASGLWRLATSVAAVVVLVTAVGLFRFWLIGASQTPFGSAGVTAQETATPVSTVTSTPIGVVPVGMELTPTIISSTPLEESAPGASPTRPPIPLLGYHLSSSLAQRGGMLGVTLTWEPAALAAQPLTVFIHLLAADGKIITQLDAPWGQESESTYRLPIPAEASPGEYQLVAGLYDPQSGQRVLAQSATETGTSLNLDSVTISPDRVWIKSVSPASGTAVDGSTVFEVEIAYELVSAPTATLKLHLANPQWQQAVTGQLPIEGISEWLPITAGEGSVLVTYEVEDSNYLATLLDGRATLYIQLATEPENGRLNILLEETFTDYEWAIP